MGHRQAGCWRRGKGLLLGEAGRGLGLVELSAIEGLV